MKFDEIWTDSVARFNREGKDKILESNPYAMAAATLKVLFSNELAEEVVRATVEMIHEKLGGFENLR